LELAKERNGSIRAAFLDARASRARESQALAAFFPTVTPSAAWEARRTESMTGAGKVRFEDDGSITRIDARWQILDFGERDLSLRGARRSTAGQELTARQRLRQTLFNVNQSYYDALRAQELQRVAESQVERANRIFDQAKARLEVRDIAKVDVLQAEADSLNAQVAALAARNRTVSANAALKAIIGLESAEPLPQLERLSAPGAMRSLDPLAETIARGLDLRPDLGAQRRFLEAQRFGVLRARKEAGLSFGVDATFGQQITPDELQSSVLSATLSYPLFDGGLLRERAREQDLSYKASQSELLQAERDARSEIESAYIELSQNSERVSAARRALDAARANFDAAIERQRLGAIDVIATLTAQVSLVTAESNFIEAVYDFTISDVRLRLVTGEPVPGE
jgi:outer membrane protein